MGLEANNKADLLKAITENWRWVFVSAKIINAEYLETNFTEDELNEAGIYTRGVHEARIKAFACGSATVEACDNATVLAYDSATVEACDNATVKAYDSATVKAYGSATVEACDNATVKAYDNSYVEDCTGNIRPADGYAIVKDHFNKKIYIKKEKFEIIEID